MMALVMGQVMPHPAHPPAYTLIDDAHPPAYTLNDEGEEGPKPVAVVKPFEMTNPSRVAAGELYQSDMLLSDEQWESLRMRKALDSDQMRWSEGSDGFPLVPYVFTDSVDQADVKAGLDHWMDHTCIKFEETSNTDQPHLQFHIGNGCWSYVGMSYWKNGQEISIGSGCNSLGTVAHEVGHAMGFHHEQSRSDRDDHVVIFMDNVQDGKEHNFNKEADNNYSVTYDYSSVMHYGQSYFSKNGKPTIITLDPMAQELIGSRAGLTHRDILLANTMYDCLGKWLASCSISSNPCQNEGYIGADCSCVCAPGTSGSICDVIDGDYYDNVRDPRSEKITTEKSIKVETPMDAGISFVKWIVPPSCMKAKVTFTDSKMYSTCAYQYLTVRTDPNDIEGQQMCSDDVTAGATLTSDTGIIITMTNMVTYSFQKTLWEADVTFEAISGCGGGTTSATTAAPTTTTKAPGKILGCQKKAKSVTIKKGQPVTIQSPNYPKPYYSKKKLKCIWKLRALKKKKLMISCDAFDLNKNDKSDIMKIGKKVFSGTTAPKLTSKKFNILFKASKKDSGKGFRCTVTSS